MSEGSGTEEFLFTYGALQAPDVQLDTFGRLIAGDDDTLPGFRLDDVESTDERGASMPHGHRRRSLRHTGDPHDRVFGTVLHLTAAELDAADEYLISDSRRIPVVLASGATAWVYVAA
ncbi:gamma-glutamylcyclotransferase family protein [Microbacterium enclense]|uniref:gamma-glutamylcyclotransferase family protein n=1 Tax=Microbacterium enclense TaxID=993073 RepID=UPI00343DE054